MQRKATWTTELYLYLEASHNKRFASGQCDCGLWVADAILAMTGTDLAKDFRGRYTSRKELSDLILQYTGKRSLLALALKITAEHHMPQVPKVYAQRGDLVVVQRSHDYSFGIVGLDGRILGISATGFTRLPLTQAFRAWRV